jgi:hypothetical protein
MRDARAMADPLDSNEIESFVERGFVPLRQAVPRALADECRALLWQQLAEREDDATTWTRPVVRLGGQVAAPFRDAMNTPRLHAAFDQLVGKGRWVSHPYLAGTVPVRFPHPDAPGDDGWHVDGAYERDGTYCVNVRSDGRALLMLVLFSDVGELDAPTRLRIGSHLAVPSVLAPAGARGLTFLELAAALPPLDDRPVEVATGDAGDVYLCHPFLVHAAQPIRGTRPRLVAQPGLRFSESLDPLAPPIGEVSPVERAIRAGLERT